MLSFRSILFAAVAFTTVVSAIPTGNGLAGPGNGLVGPGVGHALPNAANGLVSESNPFGDPLIALLHGSPSKRGQSCADYYTSSTKSVAEIIVQIKAIIYVNGAPNKNCDHQEVISLLGEIVIILKGLLANLKVEGVVALTLNGVVITVAQLAEIVAGLLILVIGIVVDVLIVVGVTDTVLIGVVVSIGGLLLEVLTAVVILVAGLDVALAVLIKPYVSQCQQADYSNIVDYLNL